MAAKGSVAKGCPAASVPLTTSGARDLYVRAITWPLYNVSPDTDIIGRFSSIPGRFRIGFPRDFKPDAAVPAVRG